MNVYSKKYLINVIICRSVRECSSLRSCTATLLNVRGDVPVYSQPKPRSHCAALSKASEIPLLSAERTGPNVSGRNSRSSVVRVHSCVSATGLAPQTMRATWAVSLA